MKWIRLSEGKYKLVEDDDSRPEDKEFASRKRPQGAPFIIDKAPWTDKPSQDVATDPDKSEKYYNHIEKEAKKWTASGKWARRERERKAYIKKQKAEWIKKGARPEDRREIMKA